MGMELSTLLRKKKSTLLRKKRRSTPPRYLGVERIGSSVSSSSTSGLPEDLVIEILLLLPVKSLLRFRCVCKSWYALIENPSFVSKHYYKSSNNINTIDTSKIIVERFDRYKHEFLFLSNESLEVSQDLDLTILREEENFTGTNRIVGSCYGIICFRDFLKEATVILWNPSTRQSKVLPEPHHLPDPRIDYDDIDYDVGTLLQFGFCYDVKTNDFKVVKFATLGCPDRDWYGAEHRTEIYSLSTDSWRLIDDAVELDFLFTYQERWTSVNGVLSNLAYASILELKFETNHPLVLSSFDTRDEVFLLTPLPALSTTGTRMHENYFGDRIMALNESVAFVQVLSGVVENRFFEIWVLNEYGSKGSWTKLYTIGEPISELLYTSWGFWKNSVLFMETQKNELVLCDLITQEIKNLQIDEERRRVLDLISYKESLVSIKGENHLL